MYQMKLARVLLGHHPQRETLQVRKGGALERAFNAAQLNLLAKFVYQVGGMLPSRLQVIHVLR